MVIASGLNAVAKVVKVAVELAMTKQTALESNLICGTLNQKLFTQCLVRVYTACTQIQ